MCITHCEPRALYNAIVIVEADERTNRWQFIPGFRRNRLIRRIRVQVSRHFWTCHLYTSLATHTRYSSHIIHPLPQQQQQQKLHHRRPLYSSVRFITTLWHVVYTVSQYYIILQFVRIHVGPIPQLLLGLELFTISTYFCK